MVRGATKSLVIDLGFVLEGQHPEELPEALLGAFRLNYLDCTTAKKIDTSRELPLLPRALQQHQLVALQQQQHQQHQQQQDLTAAALTGSAAQAEVQPAAAAAAAAASGDHQPRLSTGQGQLCSALQRLEGVAPGAQQEVVPVSQHLQQRCRNSMSVVEGGRTMTGHSHSR
jgi:hypothetical protein